MSTEAVIVSLVSGILGVLVLVTGYLLSLKIGDVDKKLDGLDAKISALGEHRARIDEWREGMEKWRVIVDGQLHKQGNALTDLTVAVGRRRKA